MSEYSRPIVYSPDTNGALNAIINLDYEMRNPYNDGFTQSIMKERLIAIKNRVDKALVNAPKFADEK